MIQRATKDTTFLRTVVKNFFSWACEFKAIFTFTKYIYAMFL